MEIVQRADEAVNQTMCNENYIGFLKKYTIVFEGDSNEILFFLPLKDLQKAKRKLKKEFFETLKDYWIAHNYVILEERDVQKEEWEEVGYDSHLFRLESIA